MPSNPAIHVVLKPFSWKVIHGQGYWSAHFQESMVGHRSTPSKYIRQDRSGNEVTGWQPNYTVNNERVLRYADILLMSAECNILGPTPNLSAAAALINQVRRRADPGGTILPDVSAALDRTQMFRALMRERRVELALGKSSLQ
jgi:hypothetical protein